MTAKGPTKSTMRLPSLPAEFPVWQPSRVCDSLLADQQSCPVIARLDLLIAARVRAQTNQLHLVTLILDFTGERRTVAAIQRYGLAATTHAELKPHRRVSRPHTGNV